MKLKVIHNERPKRKLKPTIRVAQFITINRAAAELLDVKAGDHVAIAMDEDTGEDWYILKLDKPGKKDSPLRPTGKNESGRLSFNNLALVRRWQEQFGEKPYTYQISRQAQLDPDTGAEVYLIITAPRARELRMEAARRPPKIIKPKRNAFAAL